MAYVALTRVSTAFIWSPKPLCKRPTRRSFHSTIAAWLFEVPTTSLTLGCLQDTDPQGCCGPWKIRVKSNAMSPQIAPRIQRAVLLIRPSVLSRPTWLIPLSLRPPTTTNGLRSWTVRKPRTDESKDWSALLESRQYEILDRARCSMSGSVQWADDGPSQR